MLTTKSSAAEHITVVHEAGELLGESLDSPELLTFLFLAILWSISEQQKQMKMQGTPLNTMTCCEGARGILSACTAWVKSKENLG